MALRAWPLDAVGGDPEYSGRHGRQMSVAPFLPGARPGRPLGSRSGVRAGTPTDTVSVSGSTVTVGPHAGVLDVQPAAEAGPYAYAIDDVWQDTLAPAHASLTRWDGVYVCLDDPAESDGSSAPALRVELVTGTPSSSPSMPTAPDRSMLLARIVVPQSGGGAPSVVWLAPLLAAAGGVIPVRSTAERNALNGLASALSPIVVHRADADAGHRLEVCDDGSTWRTVPSTAGLQAWTPQLLEGGNLGAGTITGRYAIVGNVCTWSMDFTLGAGAVSSGVHVFNLPVTPVAGAVVGYGYYYNGAFQTFFCQRQAGATMSMRRGEGTGDTWSGAYAPLESGNVGSFSGQYLVG